MSHAFFDAGYDPELSHPDPLTQWPLEWLQGFCLRFPLGDFRLGPPVDDATAREVEDRLRSVGATSVGERWQRRRDRYGWEPSKQVDGSWEQEQARSARMALRNWSYRPHMVSIATRLCQPLDGWSEAELGYPLSAVPKFLSDLEEEVERRGSQLLRDLQDVKMRAASAMDMCQRWRRSSLPGADIAAEFEVKLRLGLLRPRELVRKFDRKIKQGLPSVFILKIDELEALSAGCLTREGIERLLPSLSYRFGDLHGTPAEHLTMGNPVWTRPFIALEDGTYFYPLPGMGLSHILDLVSDLIPEEDEGPEEDAEKREEDQRRTRTRARFLEQQTYEVAVAAFPSATIYRNSKYDGPSVGVVLENDLAVVLDDVVVAIEAKSHRVPPEVWRGAPNGMRESIEKLVLEPSTQSENFTIYLLRTQGSRPFRTKSGGEFVIDSSGIRSAVRVNVVLDPFPVAHNVNPRLRAAHLLRDGDPEPVPTLQLAALESVLVLLPDELQRIHYLARRQVLQRLGTLHGDEHDLLALYLEVGFTLRELEDPTTPLMIRGLARKQVDPHLEQWFAGQVPPTRPMRPLTPEWNAMLAQLPVERPRDWVTIGMALLDASINEQLDMQARTARAVEVVDAADDANSVEWWATEVGLSFWRSSIVGIVTKNLAPENRASFVSDFVQRRGLNGDNPCIALIVDVEEDRKTPMAFSYFPATNRES